MYNKILLKINSLVSFYCVSDVFVVFISTHLASLCQLLYIAVRVYLCVLLHQWVIVNVIQTGSH